MVIPGTEAHGPVDQVKHLQKLKFWTSGTQMTLRSGRIGFDMGACENLKTSMQIANWQDLPGTWLEKLQERHRPPRI